MFRTFFAANAKLAMVLLISLVFTGPAAADEQLTPSQAVIESQIEAFLANDMASAYSHAAPEIKAIFPTEEKFSAMVRKGYGPVYRPGNYAFGRAGETAGGNVIQEVLISGPGGQDWTAVYIMGRQPDGTMKIRGVTMSKSAAPQI